MNNEVYGFKIEICFRSAETYEYKTETVTGLLYAPSYAVATEMITEHYGEDLQKICYLQEKVQEPTDGLFFFPEEVVQAYMDPDTDPEFDYRKEVKEREGAF